MAHKTIELTVEQKNVAKALCDNATIAALPVIEYYDTLIAGEVPEDLAAELTTMFASLFAYQHNEE